jgi:hypothetical protein
MTSSTESREAIHDQKTDILTRLLQISAILGWVSVFLVQILAWMAIPEMDTDIARYHEL